MDEKRFWDIVAVGCPQAPGASWIAALGLQLARLPVKEIDDFSWVLDSKLRAACTTDLWAATWLIDPNGDMEFLYFCNWLVGLGKVKYESVLENPDRLADLLQEGEDFAADLVWITSYAWSQAAHKSQERFWTGKEKLISPPLLLEDMAGETWDFEDPAEQQRRFPRLWQRFRGSEEVTE